MFLALVAAPKGKPGERANATPNTKFYSWENENQL